MIALLPRAEDAERLAQSGAGAHTADELHVTLAFLGDAADVADQRAEFDAVGIMASDGVPPIEGRLWAAAAFNPGTEDQCIAWLVGDVTRALSATHARVMDSLPAGIREKQHKPWAPHITARYGTSNPRPLFGHLGPVVFDRIRVSIGDVDHDYPLTGARLFPEGADPAMVASFADRNNLERYWKTGAGAAKIRWGTPGDWTRCKRHLTKRVGDERARRICAQWHHETTGLWPGDRNNPGR